MLLKNIRPIIQDIESARFRKTFIPCSRSLANDNIKEFQDPISFKAKLNNDETM